eukprot:NODE_7_length_67686_cov_1.621421.p36 type:complete len:218 gc:universal NODE_7_length_67686_cov_1.621421:65156-64503(-)
MLFTNFAYAQYGNAITSDQKAQILAIHNKARAEVGSAPLTWDDEMEKAQIQCHPVLFQHGQCDKVPDLAKTGENLASGSDGAGSANMFFAEKSSCDFNSLMTSFDMSKCQGHYSQMVWKDTKTMSCYQSGQNKPIICNYKPPGNVLGRPGVEHAPDDNAAYTPPNPAPPKPKSKAKDEPKVSKTKEHSETKEHSKPKSPVYNSQPSNTSKCHRRTKK